MIQGPRGDTLESEWLVFDCVGLGALVGKVPQEFLDDAAVSLEEGGVRVIHLFLSPLRDLAL